MDESGHKTNREAAVESSNADLVESSAPKDDNDSTSRDVAGVADSVQPSTTSNDTKPSETSPQSATVDVTAEQSQKPSKALESAGKSSGNDHGQQKSTSVEVSHSGTCVDEQSQVGASSGPSVPSQGGAGGPEGSDLSTKMMTDITSKGEAPAMPGLPGKPASAMPDMSMMGKGGGMPDMMAMMGKGGMPDMMAMMAKGGMPDMMAMMAKGGMPDMMAMMSGGGGGMPDMSKMKPNPLGMARMFECIIDVSLARPDSDDEDEDSDSVTQEIPCQYCSRFFPSQMTLKTHILVAHEKEDTSVLNITDLIIDSKGKKSAKGHGLRRKQSKDFDRPGVEAASSDAKVLESSAQVKAPSHQEDQAVAEPSRGTKRGRSRKESGAAEIYGADQGGADSESGPQSSPYLAAGAVPSSCASASPPETRKRTSRLRSLGSSAGSSSPQVTSKKIKSSDIQSEKDRIVQEEVPVSLRSVCDSKKTVADASASGDAETSSKHKKVKINTQDSSAAHETISTRGKKSVLRKDKGGASSDLETCDEPQPGEPTQSKRGSRRNRPLSSTITTPSSSKGNKSPVVATRRSLRSRKSH